MQEQFSKMPIASEETGGSIRQKYYTAEEAVAYLEPRIRALFR